MEELGICHIYFDKRATKSELLLKEIEFQLLMEGRRKYRTVVDEEAPSKKAITNCRALERNYALSEARLLL